MRHFILVIVLIGAAFLGGAFVNGPGLRWAQTQVLGTLGFGDEDEIASINLKTQTDGGPGAGGANGGPRKPKQASQGLDQPVAPAPSVLTEKASASNDSATIAASPIAKTRDPELPSHGKSGVSDADGLAPVMLPADALPGRVPPKPAKKPLVDPKESLLPPLTAAPAFAPPADTRVTTAAAGPASIRVSGADVASKGKTTDPLTSLEPPMALQAEPGSRGGGTADTAGTTKTLPLAPSIDRPSPRLPAPDAKNGGRSDWSELVRKMETLGVSKFCVEGEPGGRVVFSCLIPLAGKQAVTQRFEGDGDDIVQAVQATLRRISLWRAAQPAERAGSTP